VAAPVLWPAKSAAASARRWPECSRGDAWPGSHFRTTTGSVTRSAATGLDFSAGTSGKARLTGEQILLMRAKQRGRAAGHCHRSGSGCSGVQMQTTAAYANAMLDLRARRLSSRPQMPSADMQSVEQMTHRHAAGVDRSGKCAQDYSNQRDLAVKMFRQGSLLTGKSAKDYRRGPAVSALAEPSGDSDGVPQDARERDAHPVWHHRQVQRDRTTPSTPLKNWVGAGGTGSRHDAQRHHRPVGPSAAARRGHRRASRDQPERLRRPEGHQRRLVAEIAQKTNNNIPI
jgi:hypothetical protein